MGKRISIIVTMLVIALTSMAQTANSLKVVEKKLTNGMTVWLNEDHSQPKVFGAVVVKAGAKDCPNTGIAHYFEHLLFKGTDKIGTVNYKEEKIWLDSISAKYDLLAQTRDEHERLKIQQDINRLSGKAGEYAIPNEFENLISIYGGTGLNAYTSYDETVFHNSFSPQYISQWCELNSERMLTPVFRLFQGELETVYEEKNMYSDILLKPTFDTFSSKVFKGTPYTYPLIGSTENLKNPRLSEMNEFYNKYYVAENMVLVLSGDIHIDAIIPLIERTFGRIKRGESPQSATSSISKFDTDEGVIKLKLPIPLMKGAGYVYRAPVERDKDYVTFSLAMNLLSNHNETGLLDSLQNESKLMVAKLGIINYKDASRFTYVFVPHFPFGSIKKAEQMCVQQIEKLKRGEFSEQTLNAVKLSYKRQLEQSIEDIDSRKDVMISFASQGISWEEVLKRSHDVEKITKDDIVRVANKYLDDKYIKLEKTFGKYPKDKVSQPGYKPVTPKHVGEKSEYAKELAKMPFQQLWPRTVDFEKDADRVSLGSLATLYTTPNPMNDLFSLKLIYHKGTLSDKYLGAVAEYIGLIGTDSLSKHKLNTAFEELGATVKYETDENTFCITLNGFDSKFKQSMMLLNNVMTNLKANSDEFKDMVSSQKISEKMRFKDNDEILSMVLEKLEFGDRSLFMNPVSVAELKKMSGEQLIDKFRDVQSNELSIVYSGCLSKENVAKTIRQFLPINKVVNSKKDTHRQLMTYSKPTVYIYDNPSARQTIIGTYATLPAAKTLEDRVKMDFWGYYMGKGMSSLLFQDIREFRSFAYSVNGIVMMPSFVKHPSDNTGYVTKLGTQADKSMLALGVLDSLFNNMPIRLSNISAIKQSIINQINNSYPNFRQIGTYIAEKRAEGYKSDPSSDILPILERLDANDLESFYKERVKNSPRQIYIIGNKKTLDMNELKKYGNIVELKQTDIFKKK